VADPNRITLEDFCGLSSEITSTIKKLKTRIETRMTEKGTVTDILIDPDGLEQHDPERAWEIIGKLQRFFAEDDPKINLTFDATDMTEEALDKKIEYFHARLKGSEGNPTSPVSSLPADTGEEKP